MDIETKNRIDDLVNQSQQLHANLGTAFNEFLDGAVDIKSDLSKEYDDKVILDYLILNLYKLFNI